MELLDNLPEELHWNVIKYLQHPIAAMYHYNFKYRDDAEEEKRVVEYIGHWRVCPCKWCFNYQYIKLNEDEYNSKEFDRRCRFPTHPVAQIFEDEWYASPCGDTHDFIVYVRAEKRERLKKSRPSSRIAKYMQEEITLYEDKLEYFSDEPGGLESRPRLSSFAQSYFYRFNVFYKKV